MRPWLGERDVSGFRAGGGGATPASLSLGFGVL